MLTDSLMPLYTAGEVRRYHTLRLLHPQDIAGHSWGVALIILWLYDMQLPSAALLRAAVLHDVPECATGDVPGQLKWRNVELQMVYEKLEREFLVDHGVTYHDLTALEQWVLDFADIAELVMFSLVEISMGNVRMRLCMERGLEKMRKMVKVPVAHLLPRADTLLEQMEAAWHAL